MGWEVYSSETTADKPNYKLTHSHRLITSTTISVERPIITYPKNQASETGIKAAKE
jgi:hypothetical protein